MISESWPSLIAEKAQEEEEETNGKGSMEEEGYHPYGNGERLIVLSDSTRVFPRFHVRGGVLNLKIRPLPSDVHSTGWLQSAIYEVYRRIVIERDVTSRKYVGVSFHHSQMRQETEKFF